MKYNEHGEELPDPTPVSLTVKQRQQIDRYQLLKAQILAAIASDQAYSGEETFEESLDFDVEDDDMPMSRYEKAELEVQDMRRTAEFVREKDYVEQGKARFAKRKAEDGQAPPSVPAKPAESRDRSGKEVSDGKSEGKESA